MFGIEELLPEIILAMGAALSLGMAAALFGPALRRRYSLPEPTPSRDAPAGVGRRLEGPARLRAAFLFVVGLLMAGWGLATMIAG